MAKQHNNKKQHNEYIRRSHETQHSGGEKTEKVVNESKESVSQIMSEKQNDRIQDETLKDAVKTYIAHESVKKDIEDGKHDQTIEQQARYINNSGLSPENKKALAEKTALDEANKQIEKKKTELHKPEEIEVKTTTVEKTEVKEVKKDEKKKKRYQKIDFNPLNRARYLGTRFVSDVAAVPLRAHAKVMHVDARPQQLWSKAFWKDLGKNIIRTPKNILTSIGAAFYKPLRGKAKFEDNFKDYGPTFGPDAKDYKVLKKSSRFAGKFIGPTVSGRILPFPKFFANVERGLSHAILETLEGFRDSKRHRNPKKWNIKPWNYAKTKESFTKAFSWNAKGKPAKIVDLKPKEEKKAA